MAPEQFAGGIVDARADLYATGVLLHELLAGQPFRRGASVPELYAELSSPVVPALPFAVPHVIDAVRARLLQPQVSARFNSASEALAMLHGSPDARDASTELAALCRRITGVQAPRSDLGSSGPGGRPSKGAHDRTRRACVAHGRRFCGAPLAVARGG